MNLRRDHHGRTYELLVCPYHGHANVGCCDREPIVIETVPVQRMIELRDALDLVRVERNMLRESRQVVFNIGEAQLFGSREAVGQANAYMARLRAKATDRLEASCDRLHCGDTIGPCEHCPNARVA